MGMDVYGKNPTSENGKYFRNNVWWWRPLAEYCKQIAPEITSKIKYLQSNDGDGLQTQEDCNILADKLQEAIDKQIAYNPPENLPLEGESYSYPFSYDNVKEFITFLRSCGGFEID